MVIDNLLYILVKALLWLRYRITVSGLRQIRQRGKTGILFLPNHPALIDPVIVATTLFRDFRIRPLAFQDQIDRPVVRRLAARLNAVPIPEVAKAGRGGRKIIAAAMQTIINGLNKGENILLYPAGHTYRSKHEEIGGNSAVDTIVAAIPNVRIVLLQTTGLWGSGFSWSSGKQPLVKDALRKALFAVPSNGIFFSPRRRITLKFVEPDDFPITADRLTINRYLEHFYNKDAPHNTYVPYTWWENGSTRIVPEPLPPRIEGDPHTVPEATRSQVMEYIKKATGLSEIAETVRLRHDLGLDSLTLVDLAQWLEQEFGFQQVYADSLHTVGDVLLAACGRAVSGAPDALKPVDKRWFAAGLDDRRMFVPAEQCITDAFLDQAKRRPKAVIIADQVSGEKTYRDIITAVLVLKPEIEKISGPYVGIMLPGTVACTIVYLSVLFAGKTPVMINWTIGNRNIKHMLQLTGVKTVLTVKPLIERLTDQGIDFSSLKNTFLYLEDLTAQIPSLPKLTAWLKARLSWQSLYRTPKTKYAVMLFTSGSESLPKVVPLTHKNILSNLMDISRFYTINRSDRLIGILPPFHSLGLTGTVILPLCLGVSTVYHPNPTEGLLITRLIEAYRVTILLGTPTFLNGIVRTAQAQQLKTLRIAITGAEKCPQTVYNAISDRCPGITVLEGYGTTECSPVVSGNDENNPRPGSIGKIMPSYEYVVVDPDTLLPVAQGMRGMLLVRGPSVFDGYYAYDGIQPFVELEGKKWYRTGDLVVEDADGVLSFAGRLKRFVKLGGEMISLPAIEAVLASHFPSEEDKPCFAVAATPEELQPELMLFATFPVDRQEVNRFIRDSGLSPLHNIRYVIRIDEIPVLGTGKTDYRALKKRLKDFRL